MQFFPLRFLAKSAWESPFKPFYVFFALACERIFTKTHTIEIKYVIGPGNILFAGEYVHFSARKFYRLGQ